MEDIFFGWVVGAVMYLLFMTRDVYRVCYAPSRTEVSREKSRHAQ